MYAANDVASVIIARTGPRLDAMKLQKLLYYVQAWNVAITDEPLFTETLKAWKDGPVCPPVWKARQDPASRASSAQKLDGVVLDDFTSNLIDLVLAGYGSMSGTELSALAHAETPWREARGDLADDDEGNASNPIDLDTVARFYRAERHLAGRTAADLAVGGLHGEPGHPPVDVDAILAGIPEGPDPGPDPWGGANLAPHCGMAADR